MATYLGSQRHQHIMKALKKKNAVRTKQLAKELKVADETIRTDLILLEERGFVRRVHGGAILCQLKADDCPACAIHPHDIALADIAASTLSAHTSIFLDGCGISGLIANALPTQPLMIVTNSLSLAQKIENYPHIDLYLSGGELDRASGLFLGQAAARSLGMITINTLILTPDSYDPNQGAGYNSQAQAEFIATLLEYHPEVTIVCPAGRIKPSAGYYPIRPAQIQTLITGDDLSPELIEKIKSQDVHLQLARLNKYNPHLNS